MKVLEGTTEAVGVVALAVEPASASRLETVTVTFSRAPMNSGTLRAHVIASPPPWFARAARRLSDCGRLLADWDGEGAEAPNSVALAKAGRALEILQRLNFEVIDVLPSVESGVGFVFASGNVEFSNDGDVTALVKLSTGEQQAWDVGSDELSLLLALERIHAAA